jgi:hypothetical protein
LIEVTGLELSPSLILSLTEKGAACSLMLEPGVKTCCGAGLVIGAAASWPPPGVVLALVDVRAAPAVCAEAADALPVAASVAPDSRVTAATTLARVRERG